MSAYIGTRANGVSSPGDAGPERMGQLFQESAPKRITMRDTPKQQTVLRQLAIGIVQAPEGPAVGTEERWRGRGEHLLLVFDLATQVGHHSRLHGVRQVKSAHGTTPGTPEGRHRCCIGMDARSSGHSSGRTWTSKGTKVSGRSARLTNTEPAVGSLMTGRHSVEPATRGGSKKSCTGWCTRATEQRGGKDWGALLEPKTWTPRVWPGKLCNGLGPAAADRATGSKTAAAAREQCLYHP